MDMDLIRNIDKDVLKQELLRSIRIFAHTAGIKMIAEGIETSGELKKLIELGIDYGQGYWLGKPKARFLGVEKKAIREIFLWNQRLLKIQSKAEEIQAEDLLRKDEPLTTESTLGEVEEVFLKNSNLQGIAVVEKGKPIGLVMRNKYTLVKELSKSRDEDFAKSINRIAGVL